MKKLLCMMLGLAVGAFAYGEGEAKGGDFGFTANETQDATVEKLQWTNATDDDSKVADFETPEDPKTTSSSAYSAGKTGAGEQYKGISDAVSGNEKYRQVKNSLTDGGSYSIVGTPDFATQNVCFDTLVRFTAGVDAEEAEYPQLATDAKIGVWLKQTETDGDIIGETNLYVTAGYFNGEAYETKAYKINKTVEPGTWHRVTIRTIDTVLSSGDLTGFLVYIDGQLATANTGCGTLGFNNAAAKFAEANQLFISAAGPAKTSLSAMGFAGNGDIDDTSITWGDAVPYYAVAAVETTIRTDNDGLQKISYKIGDATEWTEAAISKANPVKLELEADTKITFNVAGFGFDETSETETYAATEESTWDASGWEFDSEETMAWTFGGDEDSYIEIGVEATPYAVVIYDGEGKFKGYTADDDPKVVSAAIDAMADGCHFKVGDEGFDYAGNYGAITFSAGTVALADGVLTITSDDVTMVSEIASGANVVVVGNANVNGSIEGDLTVNGLCWVTEALELSGNLVSAGTFQCGAWTEDDPPVFETKQFITLIDDGALTTVAQQTIAEVFTAPVGDYEVVLVPETTYTYALAEITGQVAQISDGRKFLTLAEAFAAAAATDTVTLLGNCTVDAQIKYSNKAITLTGAYTVSAAASKAFCLMAGASLTVDAGTTVTASGNDCTIFLWPYTSESDASVKEGYAKATLVVNGTVTYTGAAERAAIQTNGKDSTGGVDITINGTVTCANDAALYLPGTGTYVIGNGAYIEGVYAGIQMKAGDLTVNGGTIKCTGADATPTTPFNNGANASGCAIQLEGNAAYGTMTLTVNGGTIEATNAKAIYGYGNADNFTSMTINGGTIKGGSGAIQLVEATPVIPGTSTAVFSHDVSAYCATGYKTVLDTTDNYYKVAAIQYATLKVVAGDANVSDIVVTNAAGEVVAADTQFDIDDAVVVAFKSATFASGFELDETKGTLEVTLNQVGEKTIQVFSKAVQTEPIPPLVNPTQEKIAEVFKDAADTTLATKVTPENYAAFRDWSRAIGAGEAAGEQAVLQSSKAFVSFEMSSVAEAHLFTNDPTIKITETTAGDAWTATVEVLDGETLVHAIKAIENQVEVTTTIETASSWNQATATATINEGIATITITKPNGGKGFMRVKAAK